ncbi:MAG TPA: hypothetical protein VI141_06370 [Acidimicrobiia bacterium]
MKGRISGVALAVVGTAMVFATFAASEGSLLERHPLSFAALFFIWVGGLIVYRIGHRIGWVTAAVGLMFAANSFLDEIPVGPLTDQLQLTAWTSALFFTGLLVFWFPTGHAISPRWMWVSWIAGSAQALALIWTFVYGPEAEVSPGQEVAAVGFLIVAWFIVIAVLSLVVRYFRASGIVRQQIKWFSFAVIAVQLLNLGWETMETWLPVSQTVWDVALALALMAVPISIGVAILRFRLYEIDRLVSRTVTYVVVVGLLGAGFATLVWLPLMLGLSPANPPVLTAVSTLAVAALFNPVRKRVQRRVDRRFNRSHYDAVVIAERFADGLRDQHDGDEIVAGLIAVVSTTLSPASVGAWTRT